ncbi:MULTISPECIES: oxygen-independent coproporphyrinogen III oxidase [Arcobacteraceae]|uniref:oxygen-independent coproporphyrinogen III oxidase n=1 Tax=Arcobacteraceae TaxID=2808963 RepID=UPI00125EE781|nr:MULTISPECIES: oxygen-independent coproporphyrinogen III oxidase [Arcobacteraceae]MBF7065314.1 oxygen-independent coproporphyrinogen III oxidase [Aliarcobacter butzleri]MCG3665073.1 oxygen-independent coproporphyrinogen III oxidase [Aliarcobacter butzleri]MCG3692999.1 oxygen-independent coproporphyrinogen III oxidase [Aliarcobacter butzleri]MCT7583654.1 oxygen-independent coproporphyrinogen III oxidase [Aliarcobacter butzleri]MCT7610694.1 oxygen-independent coproporphyrinogen III oxidase [Al
MIDFAKFVKYSKPGPRYTSYPTAPEFSETFTQDDLKEFYKNQSDDRPLSLYIHMPFCRSACYFCGCNTIFTSKEDKKTRYIEYLKKELNILKNHLNTKRVVTQMHFGGGTPTFFSPSQLEVVITAIKEIFPNFSPDAEISCEVDPRYFTVEHMNVLKAGGCNRLSFGVQDLDEEVQKTIHRIQPFELTQNVIKIAREAGIHSINTDLIYGLPYQTRESFKKTLEQMITLNTDRFAVFNYAHVPWLMKTMRKFDETTFPKPEVKLEMLKDTIDFFTSNGYKMVGMDHFAKPEDELFKAIEKGELHRNFQGYTTKGGADLIGIGLTSIGNGVDYYAQNFKELEPWENAIDNGDLPVYKGYRLSDDDMLRQFVIMELMSNFSLNIKRVEEEFKINFKEYFDDAIKALKEFEDAQLLKITDNKIEVSQTGSMLIRNICMPFDAYLNKIPEEKRRFSKTI